MRLLPFPPSTASASIASLNHSCAISRSFAWSCRFLALSASRMQSSAKPRYLSPSDTMPPIVLEPLFQQQPPAVKVGEAEQPCRLALGCLAAACLHVAEKLASVTDQSDAPLAQDRLRAVAALFAYSPHALFPNST